MSRGTKAERVLRVNAARALLLEHDEAVQAARALARQHGLSLRQAYRYVEEARDLVAAQPVPAPTIAFTVKLPVPLVAALRRQARHDRRPLSAVVGEAVQQWLAAQGHGG
jgi:hypothetical protein